MPPSNTKTLASVFAAAALGLWGALDFYRALNQNPQGDQYRTAEMEARYAPAKSVLQSAGDAAKVIGYLSDSPYEQPRGQVLFFTAQYALAPRLVSTKPDQEWVLGNFAQPGDWAAAGAPHGLRVEKDLGNGLVLYRKERK